MSGRQFVSRGNNDIIIIHYNFDGDTLWCKQIGSKEEDRVRDIVTDESGNLYFTGSFSDSTLIEGRYLRAYQDQDIFLAKFTSAGDSVWIKHIGRGNNMDRGNGLTLSGSKIHVIGFFSDTLFMGSDTLISNGFTNNFFATFNSQGDYISSIQIYVHDNSDRLNSISTAKDGGVLISGFFSDTISLTDPTETEYKFISRSAGNPDIVVFRIYPDNTLAWGRTAGSTGVDQGMDAKSDLEGSIYLTGYFGGATSFDSTETLQSSSLPHAGSEDIFLAKYNSQGRLIWKRRFGGKGSDIARRLNIFNDKVVFTGHFSDTIIVENDTLSTSGISNNDTGFGLSNDGGDFISFSQIRGDGVDRGMAIANDEVGGIYIVGFFRSTELYVGVDTLFNTSTQREGFIAKGVWPLSLAVTDQLNASCIGNSDGQITVTPYFGEPPYSFSWEHDGDLTDSTATGLSAGNYKVICIDDLGQKDSLIVTVDEPSPVSINNSTTNVSCNGSANGQIDITANGGTPGYTYNWIAISGVLGRPSTVQDQMGLTQGTYQVTVTDANGCIVDSSFIVTEPLVLESSISGTDVTGAGAGDGSIDLSVTGGTPAYSYSWTGPDGYTNIVDQDPVGLDGGTYYVTITDDNACKAANNITIAEPGLLTTTTQKVDILCNGDTTGSIVVTPTGGVKPYQYQWSHSGLTDSIATNLPAGSYEIVITDDNAVKDTVRVNLTEPDRLQHIVNAKNVTCFGKADGKVDLVISGGVLPFSYSWNTGANTQNISNLDPGIYEGIITDKNGCKDTANAIVLQPSELLVNATVKHITCHGDRDGIIVLDVQGGAPSYEYLWSNTLTTDSIDYLLPGNYSYQVTDMNGCKKTDIITIIDPAFVAGTFSNVKASCFGFSDGEATVSGVGGTGPFSYLWNDPLAQTTATATNLSKGSYTVTITDSKNCIGSANTNIVQNAQIIVTNDSTDHIVCSGYSDGAVYLTVTGGTAPFTYLWSNNATSDDLTGIDPGSYSLTVTDNAGCQTPAGPFDVNDLSTPIVPATQYATDITCTGLLDGSIILRAGSANGPFKYSIDNGISWQDEPDTVFMDLGKGIYITIFQDANGCFKYGDTLSVTEPETLVLDSIVIDHPSTGESADGSITVFPNGGIPAYQYSFNLGEYKAENIMAGLDTGQYNILVKDVNECGPIDTTVTLIRQNVSIQNMSVNEISIFPNPSTGKFTIEIENAIKEDVLLEIVSINGQLVYKKLHHYEGNSKFIESIDLSNEAQGTYFIRVNGHPVNAKLMID